MDDTRSSNGGGRRKYTIRELRDERKWTRRKLATLLDVAEGTILAWELGRVQPRIEHQEKILAVFNLKWEDVAWPKPKKMTRVA